VQLNLTAVSAVGDFHFKAICFRLALLWVITTQWAITTQRVARSMGQWINVQKKKMHRPKRLGAF
jgi:hypothetical protein